MTICIRFQVDLEELGRLTGLAHRDVFVSLRLKIPSGWYFCPNLFGKHEVFDWTRIVKTQGMSTFRNFMAQPHRKANPNKRYLINGATRFYSILMRSTAETSFRNQMSSMSDAVMGGSWTHLKAHELYAE